MDRIVDAVKNRTIRGDADRRRSAGRRCCARTRSGIRRAPSIAGGLGNATVDAALRSHPPRRERRWNTRRRSPAFQQAFMDDPPAIFLAWSGARPRREQALQWSRRRNRDAISWRRSVCGNRWRRRRARATTDGAPNPAHRDQVRPPAGRRGRRCRCSPTASSRSSRSQRGTRESVVNGNQNVAVRAAEEIRRYVVTNAELLKALSADLQNTGLETVAAGSHPQELRPPVPRVPRDHAVRRSTAR